MTSIFGDRIAKREEHLRWASAVSDAALAAGGGPPERPAPAPAPRFPAPAPAPPPLPVVTPPRVAPRPAAGAPARPGTGGASGPDSMTANAPPRAIPRPAVVPHANVPIAQPAGGGLPFPPSPRPDFSPPPPAVAQSRPHRRTTTRTGRSRRALPSRPPRRRASTTTTTGTPPSSPRPRPSRWRQRPSNSVRAWVSRSFPQRARQPCHPSKRLEPQPLRRRSSRALGGKARSWAAPCP